MGALFVWSLLVLLVGCPLGAFVYGAWNLALAPWLDWREMPVGVAVVVGLTIAALVVRVRARS